MKAAGISGVRLAKGMVAAFGNGTEDQAGLCSVTESRTPRPSAAFRTERRATAGMPAPSQWMQLMMDLPPRLVPCGRICDAVIAVAGDPIDQVRASRVVANGLFRYRNML